MSAFQWTAQKSTVALALAEGYTQQEVADQMEITTRTIRRWLADIEFSEEVDRLSLMVGIAGRAERLRITQRVIREKMAQDAALRTEKDLLDWLKFAQSETDGIKLDLAETFLKAAASVAGGGSEGADPKSQTGERPAASRDPEQNLS